MRGLEGLKVVGEKKLQRAIFGLVYCCVTADPCGQMTSLFLGAPEREYKMQCAERHLSPESHTRQAGAWRSLQ